MLCSVVCAYTVYIAVSERVYVYYVNVCTPLLVLSSFRCVFIAYVLEYIICFAISHRKASRVSRGLPFRILHHLSFSLVSRPPQPRIVIYYDTFGREREGTQIYKTFF